MKKIYSIIYTIAFSMLLHSTVANSENGDAPVNISSIKLVSSNQYEALVDVSLEISEENIESAYLSSYIEEAAPKETTVKLGAGFHDIRLYFSREAPMIFNVESNSIVFKYRSSNQRNPLTIKRDLIIDWGSISPVKENAKSKAAWSGLSIIHIDRNVKNYMDFVKLLRQAGFPAHNIKLAGKYVPEKKPLGISLMIGQEVEVSTIRHALRELNGFGMKVLMAHVANEKFSAVGHNAIIISAAENYVLDDSQLDTIFSESTPDAEFYALLGGTKLPGESYTANQKLTEAQKLLDNFDAKNMTQIQTYLDEVIELSPNDPQVYVELARLQMRSASRDSRKQAVIQAKRTLEVAMKINDSHANTLVMYGYVLSLLNETEEAEKQFVKAQMLKTDNPWLYTNWGNNALAKGDMSNAIKRYQSALKMPNTHHGWYRAKAAAFSRLTPLMLNQGLISQLDTLHESYTSEMDSMDPCAFVNHAKIKALYLSDWKKGSALLAQGKNYGCRYQIKDLEATLQYMAWYEVSNSGAGKSEEARIAYNKAQALGSSVQMLLSSLAFSDPNVKIISALISKGYEIDSEDARGNTALIHTVRSGDFSAVQRLLDLGARLDRVSSNAPLSPLIAAIYDGNLTMVRLLVKSGAKVNRKLPNGSTLYQWALDLGRPDIANYLRGGQPS